MNDNTLLIALLLLFVAVFLSLEAVYIWWNSAHGPEASKIAKRLRMISAGGATNPAELSIIKQRLSSNSPAFDQLMSMVPRIEHIDRLLIQSGTDWSMANLGTYTSGLFAVGFFGTLLAGRPFGMALLVGLLAAILPISYLLRRRNQRLIRFETMLPEALDLIGRALRAGHALPSALQMAGTELPSPLGEEFSQTFNEINYGISTPEALQHLAKRVPSTDLGFFVVAVLIQRETGGNLSEILSNISHIIRERLKLFGKVRALSAEGRFSGMVLMLLPFATALLLYTIDSSFMSLLWTDPTGIVYVKAGILLMGVGALWMRQIVRIHV